MPNSIFTPKWFLILFFAGVSFGTANGQTITTVAGGIGNDSNAVVYARMQGAYYIVADGASNLYTQDNYGGTRKINAVTGNITTINYGGRGMFDASGNYFYASASGTQVFKRTPSGVITVIAGNGLSSYSGDGSLATLAGLTVADVAVDLAGNIYIADENNDRIRMVNTSGIINTVAGTGGGGYTGDGMAAVLSNIDGPRGVAVDATGNLYIADYYNARIRKVNPAGFISTVVIGVSYPRGVKVDGAGNLYVLYSNIHTIQKINTLGVASTFAGAGSVGFFGDGGPASAAWLYGPADMSLDAAGNLYIADYSNNRIRKVNTSGIISTVVGNGIPSTGFGGDGGNSLFAQFSAFGSFVADGVGNIFIPDANNHRIRKISTSGIITTIAGNGIAGYFGDGGPALSAAMTNPTGVALDKFGNLYIAEYGNNHVRKINPAGIISTVAGGGSGGLGDGGPATAAVLSVNGIAVDTSGNIYIADNTNKRIRKVNVATGIITTYAGNGTATATGDGGPATDAGLNSPTSVITDRRGNIYIGGTSTLMRKVDNAGIISSLPISGSATIDTMGNLYRASSGVIQRFDIYNYLSVVAGNGLGGYSGDNGLATAAGMSPGYVYVDTFGRLYFTNGNGIRRVCCMGNIIDKPPVYARGSTDSIFLCVGASTISIDTTVRISDGNIGNPETWTIISNPTHGTLAGFPYSMTSTGGTITPSGLTYTPTVGYAGNDIFRIKVNDGEDTAMIVVTVIISPAPSAGTIFGASVVCPGAAITLSSSITGGTWSASNGNATIGTGGIVTGITAGIDTITYTKASFCGSASTTRIITINPMPLAVIDSSITSVCVSSSVVLTGYYTGGVWSSTSPYVAVGATTGTIVGIAPGTAAISYTFSNSCGTAIGTNVMAIMPAPNPGVITGAVAICAGSTATLSNSVPGGVWSSSTPTIASINSSGVVTGIASGVAFISYTVTNGCGAAAATAFVNITPSTPIVPITGASSVCTGSTTTLFHTTPGGTWSSSTPSIATVGSTGIVTGIAPGVATISYTVSAGCGLSIAYSNISVFSAVSAGTITGSPTVCTGTTSILVSTIPGGTWSSSNTTVATVSATGIVTGVTVGSAVITYSVTNSCGTASTTYSIGVYASPAAGTLSGASSVCTSAAITLTATSSGGTWNSSNGLIASVGTGGVVTGITEGTTTISYTVSTGCGNAVVTKAITVNTVTAGTIIGVTAICAGSTTTLASTIAGGTWSSSTTSVATINSGGVVNALAAGATIIGYSVTNGCGTASTSTILSVGIPPVVASISGVAVLCNSGSTTLSDATSGGTWSSTNTGVATVNSTGVVSGISSGTSTISYILTAGCGSTGVAAVVTVEFMPVAGTLSGSSSLCASTTVSLGASVPGGTWSSSNIPVATVSPTGVVSGLSAGNANIIYSVTNSCGVVTVMRSLTVNPLPVSGTVSGAPNMCVAASISLGSSAPGGVWSSSNTAVAPVSGVGIVTGIAAGSAMISYAVTNGCGTAVTTHHVDVFVVPDPGSVTGAANVCNGTTTTLTATATGGIWTSNNTSVATVSSTGLVSGVAPGAATISYTVSNGCGTASATKNMNVVVATAGSITGITTLCPGNTSVLANTVTGGTWSSSTPAVASISGTGVVTAVAGGSSIISYEVIDACGYAVATTLFTVGSLPVVSFINGMFTICSGSATMLTDATTGGTWSSSDPAVATVSSMGLVTGISQGSCVISYMVTAGCGTTGATVTMHIEVPPVAGAISGNTSLCSGGNTTLSASAAGGIWSSNSTGIATINSTGLVTGIDTGTAAISYVVTNSCGTDVAIISETVTTVPYPGIIMGSANICEGATTTLNNTVGGGIWGSSNATVATITATGLVSGKVSGAATISYTVSNTCGPAAAIMNVNIDPLPFIAPVVGKSTVPVGNSITLADMVQGGLWSSSDANIAVINPGGILTGMSIGNVLITYMLTNSFGCSVNTLYGITVTRGMDSTIGNIRFNLYPNPASRLLTISWDNNSVPEAYIMMTDIAGRVVYNSKIETPSAVGNTVLNIFAVPDGVYTISIRSADGNYTGKLVIIE